MCSMQLDSKHRDGTHVNACLVLTMNAGICFQAVIITNTSSLFCRWFCKCVYASSSAVEQHHLSGRCCLQVVGLALKWLFVAGHVIVSHVVVVFPSICRLSVSRQHL